MRETKRERDAGIREENTRKAEKKKLHKRMKKRKSSRFINPLYRMICCVRIKHPHVSHIRVDNHRNRKPKFPPLDSPASAIGTEATTLIDVGFRDDPALLVIHVNPVSCILPRFAYIIRRENTTVRRGLSKERILFFTIRANSSCHMRFIFCTLTFYSSISECNLMFFKLFKRIFVIFIRNHFEPSYSNIYRLNKNSSREKKNFTCNENHHVIDCRVV